MIGDNYESQGAGKPGSWKAIFLHFCFQAQRERRAFTLMELLVALALFSITTGIVTNLFLLASRRQARTTTAVRVQGDARLILETITRELREGTIAYWAPLRDDVPDTALAITNPNWPEGNFVFFDRVDAHVDIGRWNGAGVDLAPLTSNGVFAEKFDILIAPSADPFEWDEPTKQYKSNDQPRATIHLVLTAPTGKAGDVVRVEAQTTIASRVYQR